MLFASINDPKYTNIDTFSILKTHESLYIVEVI